MKEHVITLGGKERKLRFELKADRPDIERLFQSRVGRPVGIREAMDDETLEGLAVLLHIGLRHDEDRKFTPSHVVDWLSDHVSQGGELTEIILELKRAIAESGICGFRFTYDDMGRIARLGKDGEVGERVQTS